MPDMVEIFSNFILHRFVYGAMISKTILVVSLAAVFAVSMIAHVSADTPGHLDIKDAKIINNDSNTALKISTVGNVNDGIDPETGEGFYGYAALTADGTGILAVTYHEPIVDSEDQPGWHTHVVDVTADTGCGSGIGVASASFEGIGNLVVTKKTVMVNQVPTSELGELTGQIISFELTIEGGEVCVNPTDSN